MRSTTSGAWAATCLSSPDGRSTATAISRWTIPGSMPATSCSIRRPASTAWTRTWTPSLAVAVIGVGLPGLTTSMRRWRTCRNGRMTSWPCRWTSSTCSTCSGSPSITKRARRAGRLRPSSRTSSTTSTTRHLVRSVSRPATSSKRGIPLLHSRRLALASGLFCCWGLRISLTKPYAS